MREKKEGHHRQQAKRLSFSFLLSLSTSTLITSSSRTKKPTSLPNPPSLSPKVYSHDPDGNEIVTFATGTDADRSSTSSSDFKLGFKLVMQPDHDLVLTSETGEIIWRTNTVGKGMGGETVYAAVDDGGVLHGEFWWWRSGWRG